MIVSTYLAYKRRCDARRAAWRAEMEERLRQLDRLELALADVNHRAAANEAQNCSQGARLGALQQRLASVHVHGVSDETRALKAEIAHEEQLRCLLMSEMEALRQNGVAARNSLEAARASVHGELHLLKPLTVREMVGFVVFGRHPANGAGNVAGAREVEVARRVFELVEVCVPRRVAYEELGDAHELIQRLVAARRPRCLVRLKIATTVFWVGVHAIGHVIYQLRGRKGA